MNEIKLSIKNQEFLLKKTNKSLIDFETMLGKPISEIQDSYSDTMALFYCMLRSANRGVFKYTYEEFLDVMDDEDNLQVKDFNDYMQNITPKTEQSPAKKKKK